VLNHVVRLFEIIPQLTDLSLIPRRMPTITCDGEVEIGPGKKVNKREYLVKELSMVEFITATTRDNLDTENPYFKGFINEDLQDDNTVNALKKDVFGKLNSLYHSDFAFTITCDGTTEACKEQAGKKYSYGHTDARTSTVNLCDDFFRQPSTEDMQNNCGDDRTLDEFETGGELDTLQLILELGLMYDDTDSNHANPRIHTSQVYR